MVSDNAKTFKSAENKLSALFDFKEVQDYFLAKRIQWKHNLEEAPCGEVSGREWLNLLSVV